MASRLRSIARPILVLLVVAAAYAVVRYKRAELVDFVVPRTAAVRFLAHESLYRPDDGHYQYKYLPAFALLMVPFTWVAKEVAEFTWFALTIAMAATFIQLSLDALPGRRRSAGVLVWLTLLLLRRPLYTLLMQLGGVSVGAVLIAACLIYLRRRALA